MIKKNYLWSIIKVYSGEIKMSIHSSYSMTGKFSCFTRLWRLEQWNGNCLNFLKASHIWCISYLKITYTCFSLHPVSVFSDRVWNGILVVPFYFLSAVWLTVFLRYTPYSINATYLFSPLRLLYWQMLIKSENIFLVQSGFFSSISGKICYIFLKQCFLFQRFASLDLIPCVWIKHITCLKKN